MARVLVVDDDRSIRRTLEKLFESEGHRVATAENGKEALDRLAAASPPEDLMLLDLGLPGVDGMEVLAAATAGKDPPAVLVVTARDDMRSTVKAIQLGAYDYLVKPLDIERLKLTVRRALESRATSRALHQLMAQASSEYQVGNIIGRSSAIREIYKTIGAVSTSVATVLILGESGTGKELIAKAIHYSSADPSQPFVAVNCTAFARELLESELFGHARGSFTGAIAEKLGRFELAGAGTLFLDEIGEIPIDLQAKLLRVLQEKSFERVGEARPIPLKARVIAATHRDLPEMVRAGTFREDLLYRLKVVEIQVPPLRERREDIPLLVEALLAKINKDLHKSVGYVSDAAMAQLSAYAWPGNVRELENALTRAVVLAKGDVVEAGLLPILSMGPAASSSVPAAVADGAVLPLREVERLHIERTLGHTGWNKRRTCALLEISRPTLDRKIEEYGLLRPPGAASVE